MNGFWSGKNVLVTGGSGFIGSHVVEELISTGANVTATIPKDKSLSQLTNLQGLNQGVRMTSVDLTNFDDCARICKGQDVVFGIAHVDGSVMFKQQHPALLFRQNMMITLNMLHAASNAGVDRFLITSSAEVYAISSQSPIQEDDEVGAFADRPHDGYVWSKRMTELAATLWSREFENLKIVVARPNNVYGPRDNFDIAKGRVIPIMIQKVLNSREPIVLWGDGQQVRTFLYVKDLVHGIMSLVEHSPKNQPVNFGGVEEVTIQNLALEILKITDRPNEVICDLSKPTGMTKRSLGIDRAKSLLGFTPPTPLNVGLQRTIEYYMESDIGVSSA